MRRSIGNDNRAEGSNFAPAAEGLEKREPFHDQDIEPPELRGREASGVVNPRCAPLQSAEGFQVGSKANAFG